MRKKDLLRIIEDLLEFADPDGLENNAAVEAARGTLKLEKEKKNERRNRIATE